MANSPEILLTDSLGAETRHLIDLAKPYSTVLLLYSDDFSDKILASWAELDRLNLHTRRIGQVYSDIEVHSFGLDEFPDNAVLELHIREISRTNPMQDSRRTAYKSLLNELTIVSVQLRYRTLESAILDNLS